MAIRDMVARHTDFEENKDFVPTPPYVTRALFEIVEPRLKGDEVKTCYDPAMGQGHMCKVFKEYGKWAVGSDLYDHVGLGDDFTPTNFANPIGDVRSLSADAIITNPPYSELNGFIREGLHSADKFLALLIRVQGLETQGRYNEFYSKVPPTTIALFSDRIPFKVGKVVRKAPKMYFHMWLVWDMQLVRSRNHPKWSQTFWIRPDAQKLLEKDEDYE